MSQRTGLGTYLTYSKISKVKNIESTNAKKRKANNSTDELRLETKDMKKK